MSVGEVAFVLEAAMVKKKKKNLALQNRIEYTIRFGAWRPRKALQRHFSKLS